jgi:hypothetical protein
LRRDGEILRLALQLHAASGPVVDLCYGRGVLWRGIEHRYHLLRCDLDAEGCLPGLGIIGDWSHVARFIGRGRMLTAVADPPHLSHLGRTSLHHHFATVDAPNVLGLVGELLDAAAYVLDYERGTCIVKLGDQVHGRDRQWQWFRTIELARDRGWLLCDEWAVDGANVRDFKHLRQEHFRSQVRWLVLHPGATCPGTGIALPGRTRCTLPGCGLALDRQRVHRAAYCSPAHRQAAYRQRQKRGGKR